MQPWSAGTLCRTGTDALLCMLVLLRDKLFVSLLLLLYWRCCLLWRRQPGLLLLLLLKRQRVSLRTLLLFDILLLVLLRGVGRLRLMFRFRLG